MEGAKRLTDLRTRLLSLAALHSDRLVNEELGRAGARKWHYAVLATLDEFGPASQAELSNRTRIYRSDLVAVINELAEQGNVERSPDPADRRRNVVSLTDAGRLQLRRLDEVLAGVENGIFAPLSAAERAELARMLTVVIDHHGGHSM
ncbi:MarR family winged helix-turn-helix transcriptional regulator [Actinoplanes sp. GCM10030250]|uniref:MarR family winged helix-turn-helix transcriptional regulator n=1 Tax=Actinoplanes sp. GCM10030250 TaxID=3273376 RepID=UPI003609E185